jgi:trimeric autotransporter adhesin
MKRIPRVAVAVVNLPFLVALGACSSSSTSPTQAGSMTNDASAGGDSGNNPSTGDDGGTGDDSSSDASPATPYSAKLQGAQVSPTAVITQASGTASFALQADNVTLNYDITQNVRGATAVSFHIGAPGENGSISHQIMTITGHMTGSYMLSQDEQNALAIDQLYIDIQSSAYPNGEIRGQITNPGETIYVTQATGSQEVPPATSAYAGHGSFILSADGMSVLYHVVTTAVPTNVLLELGIASTVGKVLYPLTPAAETLDGTVQLTGATDATDLGAGRFYLNIQTAAFQTGELRGQILSPGEKVYTGVLAGRNEVPPVGSQATGGAQFVLSADQTILNYEADVSGIIPTSADVADAPTGQTGTVIYPSLTLAQSNILGSTMITSANVPRLTGGNLYINVKDQSYPSGELRAQLIAPAQ